MGKGISFYDRQKRLNFSSCFNSFPKFLRENFSIIFISVVSFVGWFFGVSNYTIMFVGLYICLILLFGFNIRNVFPFIFILPSCISGIYNYIPFAVTAGLSLLGVLFYVIRHVCVFHEKVVKGKLFWGLLCLTICFMFGGLIGHFVWYYNLLVLGLCLGTYLFYFLAINFCLNFKTFFRNMVIGLAILLTIQFFICHLRSDIGFISSIEQKAISCVGEQNVNNLAVYFALAMVVFFQMGYKKRKDYLYCLPALFFAFMTFLTYCRMGTLVAFVIGVAGVVVLYVKSQNKKVFNWLFVIVGLLVVAVIILGFVFNVVDIFDLYKKLDFTNPNGREYMFPWAFDRFKENPIFGIGYFIEEGLPIALNIRKVTVDNTVLQYLLSTGAFGLVFASVFYFFKYKIVFKKFNEYKMFIFLCVLLIALNGITSQAPTTDIFMVAFTVMFVACAEIDTNEVLEEEKKKREAEEKLKQEQNNNKKNKKKKNTNRLDDVIVIYDKTLDIEDEDQQKKEKEKNKSKLKTSNYL